MLHVFTSAWFSFQFISFGLFASLRIFVLPFITVVNTLANHFLCFRVCMARNEMLNHSNCVSVRITSDLLCAISPRHHLNYAERAERLQMSYCNDLQSNSEEKKVYMCRNTQRTRTHKHTFLIWSTQPNDISRERAHSREHVSEQAYEKMTACKSKSKRKCMLQRARTALGWRPFFISH